MSERLPPRPLATPRNYAAELATAQLIESMERAGPSLVAPLGLATLVLLQFWTTSQRVTILIILGALCAFGLLIQCICRLAKPYALSHSSAPMAKAIAGGVAFCLGATWAVLPTLLYPGADADQRLLLVAALCGAIGNVCLMGSAWPIGIAYVMPLVIGGFFGIAGGRDDVSSALACLLLVAGAAIGFGLDRNRQIVSRRIIDRLEIDDRAFTVDRLLLDFETETTNEWIWQTDARGRFQNVALRMADTIGKDIADLEGMAFKDLLIPTGRWAEVADGAASLLDTMKLRGAFRNRVVEISSQDETSWWRLSGKPTHDGEGQFSGYRGVGTDITASRNAEDRIAYLANHDICTGLPNRVCFDAHARRECEAGRPGALLALDLDGFKAVNDRLGNAAGDDVLKETARRLQARIPNGHIVARLGSDEFAIWCPNASPTKALDVAHALVEMFRVPFTLQDGARVDVGASIGIALTPKHATDADHLLVRANLSMHRAKADGGGLARVFTEEYEESLTRKRTLEADIRIALARREFELHYQPILDLGTGEVVCFEALIRWHSPSRGMVSPVDFIPAAESAGLIVEIDRWVLRQACEDATAWPQSVHVATNISPDHFRSADLLNDVRLALHASGLDPRRLDIEVTEGVFLDKSARALDTLNALRRQGVQIALDDFGTGYSSLSYLINFPIDKIKIDKSFVRDLIERHESRAIIDAILSLARKLNIKVVTEGIETREQALALKLRRCDQIQGYLLSQAKPQSAIKAMLADVPLRYRDAVPTHVDSALGRALALKRQAI